MIESIQHLTRYEARSFLESAYDCNVPADPLAYANTLPLPHDAHVIEAPATVADQRAAIWEEIRIIWRRENRYDTHAEMTCLRRLGLRGVNARWKEKRNRTFRLLEKLAAFKEAETPARKLAA